MSPCDYHRGGIGQVFEHQNISQSLAGMLLDRFGHLPILEALFLGALWGVVAVGALLFAIAQLLDRPSLLPSAVRAWVVGGAVFLLFGAMNYYTHIGMYFNIAHGTMHLW